VLDRWSRLVSKRPWAVVGIVLTLLIVAGIYGVGVFDHLSTGNDFEDPANQSTQSENIAKSAFSHTQSQLLVLFSSPNLTTTNSAFMQIVNQDLRTVSKQPNVIKVLSYYNSGEKRLLSNDRHATFAQISLNGSDAQQQTVYKDLAKDFQMTSGPVRVQLGGNIAVSVQINQQITSDLKRAEKLSLPIVAILLILIFGNVVAALVPLFLGGLSILGALFVTRVLSDFTTMSAYVINVITLLGLGLAIDYSLFLVGRFREELNQRGEDKVAEALHATVKRAGRTIIFSGTTVIISLLSLTVFPEIFLRSMGMSGAAVVLTAVLLSITLVPATLCILGPRINAWSLPGRNIHKPAKVDVRGFWYRFSNVVMRRPVVILAVTLLVLLTIGSQFLHARLSSPDIYSAPASFSSRQVNDDLNSQFSNTSTEPISVVIGMSGNPLASANIAHLKAYVAAVEQKHGVIRVDSLMSHLPPNTVVAHAALQTPQLEAITQQYVSGHYEQLTIYQSFAPQSDQAQTLVKALRAIPVPAGFTPLIGGVSAELVDLLHSLSVHIPIALTIIFCATIVLIFLLMGGVLVPIKAILLGVISLSAAFGILVWVFQSGHLASALSLSALGSIDATSVILIFAIAFGLSMDYEFFLLSRIKEEYEKTGDNRHSVAYGVQKTAGIITSAALLLISVIGLFTTSKISLIQQIGMGLAVAVAIDSTLVRMVLVPATMRLLGRANWWAPKPLKLVYKKIGLHD
jgi:uncharacterized membrane protein YdfJ with MMPL/SSD domain